MSRRQGKTAPWCQYCRRTLLPSTAKSELALTKDHVIPKSAGGVKTVPCCRTCNNLKGNLAPYLWRRFTIHYPGWWKMFRTNSEVRRALRAIPEERDDR